MQVAWSRTAGKQKHVIQSTYIFSSRITFAFAMWQKINTSNTQTEKAENCPQTFGQLV